MIKLARLILRRDRWLLSIWILVVALVPVVFVGAFRGGFPTPQALQAYAETSVHNTGFIVSYGPLYGSSLAQLVAWRSGFIPVVIALFSVLMVIRHTRTEEESGRRELIGSTAVGRHAGLAAALLTTCGANLLLGLLSALALISTGLPTAGSIAFGLGLATTGIVFAAIGAVIAQFTTGAGSARGIGIVIVGVALILRGVGDVSAQSGAALGWISWLSPIGWAHQFRPYSGENWWVILLVTGAVGVLTWVAVALSARRDLGSGLFRSRPGPAVAGRWLRTPLGLAWRLHRGSLAGRVAGFAVLGLALGGIAKSIADLLDNSTPAARQLLVRLGGHGPLVDHYFWGMCALLGIGAAAYSIQSVLQLRSEETSGRAEPLLAEPVERVRWATGHLAFALLGPTVGIAVFGVSAGMTYGLTIGDLGGQLPRVLAAALVQLPAVWLFAGLAFALFGFFPRFAVGSFAVLAVSLLAGWFSGELNLGPWLRGLSVFAYLPELPGGELNALPLVVLTVIAAALMVAGLVGLRRRDLFA
jgi:ABC-2 type transport system permease protein